MEIRFVNDEYVWNIPLEQAPNSQFLQSWWWGVFQQTFGRKAWRFQVLDGETVIGAMQCFNHPLPGGRQYLYAPHGPVFLTDDISLNETIVQDVYRGLKEITKQETFAFARIEPIVKDLDPSLFAPLGFREVKSIQPQDELSAVVTPEEEDMLASMHEKTRYNIRLAIKHGVRSRLIEQYDYGRRVFPMFWEMLQMTGKRQKIRLHEREYYLRMLELFMPKGVTKLLIAESENNVIAAHLLWVFGDTVYFLHGGSDYEHRNLMAPFLLHWEGMKLAKKLGKKYYNFGGVAPENQPAHPWLNLTRFKEGFVKMGTTGERFHYPGGLDLVFQPFWYTMYSAARTARRAIRFPCR